MVPYEDIREKKSMACMNCRKLKVKCIHPDPNDPSSPCARCLKSKKECKYQVTRKRRANRLDISPTQASSSPKLNYNASRPADQPYGYIPGPIPSGVGPVSGGPALTNTGFDGNFQPQIPMTSSNPAFMDQHSSQVPMFLNGASPMSPPSLDSSQSMRPVGGTHNVPVKADEYLLPNEFDITESQRKNSLTLRGEQGLRLFQIEATPRNRYISEKVMGVRDTLMLSWKKITEAETENDRNIDMVGNYKPVNIPQNNVVAQHIITADEAWRRVRIYREEIYHYHPVVHILEDKTVDQLIQETPILFHCIMDIASLRDKGRRESVSMTIHNLAFSAVTFEVLVRGNKNLELLNSLILLMHWYNEPYFVHRQKMYLLISMIRALAYDLGLGGRQPRAASIYTKNPVEEIIAPRALSDHTSKEAVSAWLATFCMSHLTMSSNQGPNATFWNEYTEDAIKMLSQEPVISPKEFRLCDLAAFCSIQEEITTKILKKNNDCAAVDFSDPSVRMIVEGLDDKIEKEREERPASCYGTYLCTKAYLHQYVLYSEFDRMRGRSLFTNLSLRVDPTPLPDFVVKSFTTCFDFALAHAQLVLETPMEDLALWPMIRLSNIVFCATIVVKCRMVCLFNKAYADARYIPETAVDTVADLCRYLDRICEVCPYLNSHRTINFMIKLVISRADYAIHNVLRVLSASELDIRRTDDTLTSMTSPIIDGGTSLENFRGVSLEDIDKMTPENGPLPQMDPSGRFLSVPEDQLWNLGDDFWKDMLPNEKFVYFDF